MYCRIREIFSTKSMSDQSEIALACEVTMYGRWDGAKGMQGISYLGKSIVIDLTNTVFTKIQTTHTSNIFECMRFD